MYKTTDVRVHFDKKRKAIYLYALIFVTFTFSCNPSCCVLNKII